MKFLIILIINMTFVSTLFSATHNSVIFSFVENNATMYYDSNGKYKGIFAEITKEIFENQLGMKIVYHSRPWKRAQYEIAQGIADFMITVPTKKRAEYTIKTAVPCLNFFIRIYTYKNHPKLHIINSIKQIPDIKKLNLIPVTYLGNGWHKNNVDIFGIKTHYVKDKNSAFLFLANHRADILLHSELYAKDVIEKNNLKDKIITTNIKFGPIEMYILISKKSKLTSKINQINNILFKLKKTGYIENLKKKYIH